MTKAEKQISDLRYKMREISAVGQNEEKKKRMKRTDDGLRDLWDNIKHTTF